MSDSQSRLDQFFGISKAGSSVKTEISAGITTFLTMVYIVFVNPQILGETGMDPQAVFVVTCLVSAIGSIAMGLFARIPVAVAPAMGLNAFLAFSVCIGMGVSWQLGMGAVFWGATLFLIMSLTGFRQWLLSNIPSTLRIGIGAGIGLFITLLGMKGAGIIVANPATMVALGDLTHAAPALGCLSFLLVVIFTKMNIKGAILWAIAIVSILGVLLGEAHYSKLISMPPSIASVFGQLDLAGSLQPSMLAVIFSFMLVNTFDSSGTLIGVTERAGLSDEKGRFPNMRQATIVDSAASVLGTYMGTSSVGAYVESSSGVAQGGRTGLMAIVVGLLFLGALFFSPLMTMIQGYAVAGALIYVGVLMASDLKRVNWDDVSDSAPAFITMIMMPFTFSISDGIAFGFISFCVIKAVTGNIKEVNPTVWIISALFLIKFIFAS